MTHLYYNCPPKGFREGDREKRGQFMQEAFEIPGRTGYDNMNAIHTSFNDPEKEGLKRDLANFFVQQCQWKLFKKWHQNPYTVTSLDTHA